MSAATRSGLIFVGVNMAAGILNYLYQVVASKQLDASEFSKLNAWIAYFSLFLVLASTCQYAANFKPASQAWLKKVLALITVITASCLGAWFLFNEPMSLTHGALIVLSASAVAWLMGEVQTRLMFGIMAIANLGLAASKLLTAITANPNEPLTATTLALIIGYLPIAVFLAIALLKSGQNPRVPLKSSWASPLLLSVASTLIPQMDMILVHLSQPTEVFEEFAHASLFYKGIYFLIFIFSQWLLPQQVHQNRQVPGLRYFIPGYVALTIASGLIAFASPFAVSWWLKWPSAPSAQIIFLSCLNISLLAWIYLHLQRACAEGRLRAAAATLIVLGLEMAWQLYAGWSLNAYYAFALACQSAVLVFVMRSTR